MQRLIFIAIFITMISACSIGGGNAPQDHFYRLPVVDLSATQLKKPLFDRIVIKPVKATGLYHERAILFVDIARPLELQRYHYSFWASTPAQLMHNALQQGVKSSGAASLVSRNATEQQTGIIVESRITHFERNLDQSQVNVLVGLDVSVRDAKRNTVLLTKVYTHSQPLTSVDMHASVNAFGVAIEGITTQLIEDLRSYSSKQ